MADEPCAGDVRRTAGENSTRRDGEPPDSSMRGAEPGDPDFRREVHTPSRSQLLPMALEAGEEIGEETHGGTDRVLVFAEGEAVIAGRRRPVPAGDVAVVPAGTRHDFIAGARGPLELCTVDTPPEHAPGTVHRTRGEADAAEAAHHGR